MGPMGIAWSFNYSRKKKTRPFNSKKNNSVTPGKKMWNGSARMNLTNDVPWEKNMSGWDEWGQHVLEELKRLNRNIEKIDDKHNSEISDLRVKVAKIETRSNIYSGVFGALGGALLAIPMFVMAWLKK